MNFENETNLPNLAMYDIQYDQNDGVNKIINDNGIELFTKCTHRNNETSIT